MRSRKRSSCELASTQEVPHLVMFFAQCHGGQYPLEFSFVAIQTTQPINPLFRRPKVTCAPAIPRPALSLSFANRHVQPIPFLMQIPFGSSCLDHISSHSKTCSFDSRQAVGAIGVAPLVWNMSSLIEPKAQISHVAGCSSLASVSSNHLMMASAAASESFRSFISNTAAS